MKNIKNYKQFILGLTAGLLIVSAGVSASGGDLGGLFKFTSTWQNSGAGGVYVLEGKNIEDGTVTSYEITDGTLKKEDLNISLQDTVDQVSTNSGAISTLDGKITTNETNISTLRTDINSNDTDISNLDGRVTTNENSINTINNNINLGGKWTIAHNGEKLEFKYNGVTQIIFSGTSSGTGEIEATQYNLK